MDKESYQLVRQAILQIKLDGVASLVADPPWWNSNTRQKPPGQRKSSKIVNQASQKPHKTQSLLWHFVSVNVKPGLTLEIDHSPKL